MKYLIMECHPSYAVALEDNGTFLKVANMHYVPGQRVAEVIPMQVPEKKQKAGYQWIRSLAAAAACLVLVLTTVVMMGRMPYASVYLTINPQVRVDVNRSDVVVDVVGVNEDGIDLIEDYTFKKKKLDTVMDDLVDIAIEKGYLHPGGEINLSFEAEDENWVTSHEEALPDQLNTYLTDKITVDIHVERMTHSFDTNNTDYDESDYGQVQQQTEPAPGTDKTDYDADDGKTDYGASDYSRSDYGRSDYSTVEPTGQAAAEEEQTTAEKKDDSDYDDKDDDDDDDDDGDSDYEKSDYK